MIAISFFLLLIFALSRATENVTSPGIDLNIQVNRVMNTAYHHIYHEMPTAGDLFFIVNSPELLRLESNLKSKIIDDLKNQIIDVWAEMNVRILRGLTVLKTLRDKAKELVKKLQDLGGGELLRKQNIKQKISERVKELLESVKVFFCSNENDSTFFFAESHLRNLSSRLDNENVKRKLLKLVYYNRIFGIANLTDFQYTENKEELLELWALVTSWGKWAVLDLMVYIRKPLEDLNSDINQNISNFVSDVEDLMEDIANLVLEILSHSNEDEFSTYLSNVLNGIENIDDIRYSLCNL